MVNDRLTVDHRRRHQIDIANDSSFSTDILVAAVYTAPVGLHFM